MVQDTYFEKNASDRLTASKEWHDQQLNYGLGLMRQADELKQQAAKVKRDDRDEEALRKLVEQARRLGESANDNVEKPAHYTKGKIEVIDFLEDQDFNLHAANVVKYVARYRHKGKPVEDLKKARWYLDRLIAREEKKLDKEKRPA